MPIQLVSHPPEDVLVSLVRLTDERCPYPDCESEPTHLVMMRENRKDGPTFENCLPLCSEHAHLSVQGGIELALLRTIRQYLRPARGAGVKSRTTVLSTRSDYLRKVCEVLSAPTRELRCIYVGPLVFHPDWYFLMQEGKTGDPSMDRAISRLIADPNCMVHLLLRNNERYAEKVRAVTPSKLFRPLLEEVRENAKLAFANPSNTITCGETGVFQIPLIVDNAYVAALRGNLATPIEAGIYSTDPKQVDWEKQAYDRLFAHYETKAADPLAMVLHYIDSLDESPE